MAGQALAASASMFLEVSTYKALSLEGFLGQHAAPHLAELLNPTLKPAKQWLGQHSFELGDEGAW